MIATVSSNGSWLLFLTEMRQAVRNRRTAFVTVVVPLAFCPLLFGLMGHLVRQEGAPLADFTPALVEARRVPEQGELGHAITVHVDGRPEGVLFRV